MGITEGQLKKRGKTWHWRYRLDGVLKSRSLKTDSYQEARRIRQALIVQYNEDRESFVQRDQNPTVQDFESLYFDWAESNRHRAATVQMKRLHWRYLVAFTKAKRLGDITPARMEAFKSHLINVGPQGKPYSKTSVNIALRAIKSMLSLAIKNGWYTGENPAKGGVHQPCHSRGDGLSWDALGKMEDKSCRTGISIAVAVRRAAR